MLSPKRIGVIAAVVATGLIAAGVVVVAEDEQTPPPAPQQPAPRELDNEGDLRLIRQTPTRIVLGWTPELTGYGYLFSGDGTVVARTTDPARSTATFRNIYASYEVAAIDKGDTGTYSPLAGTLTMTVIAETANTITFGWTPQAEYGYLFSGDGDVISRTYDPNRSYAKFNKIYTDYEVAVLVKGATGTYPPSADTANLWVDTDGGTCTRQSSPSAYSDAAACDTFNNAYVAAQPGDTVLVKAGALGDQVIVPHAAKNGQTADVVFDVEEAAQDCTGIRNTYISDGNYGYNPCDVDIDSLEIQTHDITVRNMSTPEYVKLQGINVAAANNLTLINMHSTEGFIVGQNILWQGGEIGGRNVCETGNIDGLDIWQDDEASSNVTIDGVLIHDIYDNLDDCGLGYHVDCVQLLAGHFITIKNSRIWNCATSSILARPFVYTLDNITYENNMIGRVYRGGNTMLIGNTSDDCGGTNYIRFNTIYDEAGYQSCQSSNVNITGNIAPGVCITGTTTTYNVWTNGASCGSNFQQCTPTYAGSQDPDLAELYLSGSDTCAKTHGNPTTYPSTDIDGDTRPSGTGDPDAGADEIG